MKIKITRNLSKSGNVVTSKITVRPKLSVLEDTRRQVYQFIGLLAGYLSLEPNFKLVEIAGDFFDKVYKYEVINEDLRPEIFKEYSFEYFPNMKRKCGNCIHVRRYNGNRLFCDLKSKKIKGKTWDNCWDWNEKSMIVGDKI